MAPFAILIQSGTLRSGDATRLRLDDGVTCTVYSNSSTTRTSAWYARVSGVSNALTSLRVTYRGFNSRSCT